MKKYLFALAIFSFAPLFLFSQATTNNIHNSGEYDLQVTPEWVAHVVWYTAGNYRYGTDPQGNFQTRYSIHYRDKWYYTNLVTGETVSAPGTEHATGVYTYYGPGNTTNDQHHLFHYVKDPLFGSYHIVFNIFFSLNPDTGYMEIVDIQNEWAKG